MKLKWFSSQFSVQKRFSHNTGSGSVRLHDFKRPALAVGGSIAIFFGYVYFFLGAKHIHGRNEVSDKDKFGHEDE